MRSLNTHCTAMVDCMFPPRRVSLSKANRTGAVEQVVIVRKAFSFFLLPARRTLMKCSLVSISLDWHFSGFAMIFRLLQLWNTSIAGKGEFPSVIATSRRCCFLTSLLVLPSLQRHLYIIDKWSCLHDSTQYQQAPRSYWSFLEGFHRCWWKPEANRAGSESDRPLHVARTLHRSMFEQWNLPVDRALHV